MTVEMTIEISKTENRERYAEYLKSDHWANLKQEVFAAKGKFCQFCKLEEKLHGHHLCYKNLIDCKIEDIMILCEGCHNLLHKISSHYDFYNFSAIQSENRVLQLLQQYKKNKFAGTKTKKKENRRIKRAEQREWKKNNPPTPKLPKLKKKSKQSRNDRKAERIRKTNELMKRFPKG